jgi:hypothetical protein
VRRNVYRAISRIAINPNGTAAIINMQKKNTGSGERLEYSFVIDVRTPNQNSTQKQETMIKRTLPKKLFAFHLSRPPTPNAYGAEWWKSNQKKTKRIRLLCKLSRARLSEWQHLVGDRYTILNR